MKIKLNFKLFSIDIVDLDSESRFLQPIQFNRLNQKIFDALRKHYLQWPLQLCRINYHSTTKV